MCCVFLFYVVLFCFCWFVLLLSVLSVLRVLLTWVDAGMNCCLFFFFKFLLVCDVGCVMVVDFSLVLVLVVFVVDCFVVLGVVAHFV